MEIGTRLRSHLLVVVVLAIVAITTVAWAVYQLAVPR